MNKIIYKFSFLLGIVFLIAACEKERVFPEYHEIEHGVYPSQIGAFTGPNGKDFNFTDPGNASVTFTVEFYDDQNGACAETYCWTVSHAPTGTSAQIACQNKSQFVINPDNGRPSATFTFTMQQVLDVLGLTLDDIEGGQAFDFYATLTTCTGHVFDRTNTNAVTQGQPAFRALFQFKTNLVCPSDLGGNYLATTTGQSTDGCCPDPATLTDIPITLTDKGSGVYTISDWSAGLYLFWYAVYGITPTTNMTATFTDACKVYAIPDIIEPFGTATVFTNVSLDEATGVITYTWTNGYDDTGTVVLTPQ